LNLLYVSSTALPDMERKEGLTLMRKGTGVQPSVNMAQPRGLLFLEGERRRVEELVANSGFPRSHRVCSAGEW
jgi:hypothetical protein